MSKHTRDGDGDGFIYDGTPRQRPVARRGSYFDVNIRRNLVSRRARRRLAARSTGGDDKWSRDSIHVDEDGNVEGRMVIPGLTPEQRRQMVQRVKRKPDVVRRSNITGISRNITGVSRRARRSMAIDPEDIKAKYGLEGPPRPYKSKRGDEGM